MEVVGDPRYGFRIWFLATTVGSINLFLEYPCSFAETICVTRVRDEGMIEKTDLRNSAIYNIFGNFKSSIVLLIIIELCIS